MSNRSYRTRTSTDRATQTTEMGTQTDDRFTPATSPSRSDQSKKIVEEEEKPIVVEPEEIDYTKVDLSSLSRLNHSDDFDGTTVADSPRGRSSTDRRTASIDNSYKTDTDDDEDYEEPVIFEAASAQAQVITPQAIKARGGLVNIPKRPPPPPLPPRNLARPGMVDQASGRSPLKDSFESIDVHGTDRQSNEAPRKLSDAASEKKSVEADKAIVMEDLEKKDSNDTKRESFEDKVEHELEVQHMNHITPIISLQKPMDAEDEKMSLKNRDDDDDTFHSVPTTPNEQMEVKPMTAVA